jgi:hypothetical protein
MWANMLKIRLWRFWSGLRMQKESGNRGDQMKWQDSMCVMRHARNGIYSLKSSEFLSFWNNCYQLNSIEIADRCEQKWCVSYRQGIYFHESEFLRSGWRDIGWSTLFPGITAETDDQADIDKLSHCALLHHTRWRSAHWVCHFIMSARITCFTRKWFPGFRLCIPLECRVWDV